MNHGLGSFLGGASRVVSDVIRERARQDAKHPETGGFPDGTHGYWRSFADKFREECDRAASRGEATWRHVMVEEVFEAFAETEPALLREELVQVAAVAFRWIEALDARAAAR